MNFEVSKSGDAVILKLHERHLNAMIAPELKAEFLTLCRSPLKVMVVDMKDVEYSDTAGLSSLLFCERRMREIGGEVWLVGVSERVRSLMRIARIDSLFKFIGDEKELKKKLKRQD